MRWIFFAVLVHVGYSITSKPLTLSKYETKILDEIEKFQSQMKTGVPEAGMPVMEPFDVPDTDLTKLPIDLGSLATLKTAKVSNTRVVGLSDFKVDHIKLYIMMMKILINMTFTHVHVKGHYDLDGNVLGFVPIFGKGLFDVSVHEVFVSATAVLGTKNKKMQIEKLQLHSEIGDIKLNVEGILGGGSLGQVVNEMLQNVAAKLAKNLAPKLAGEMSEFARKVMNEALAKMDIGGLVIG